MSNDRRAKETGGAGKRNPASKYLQWKSDHKALGYWDKEKKENVILELPYQFIFLAERHCVGGWHDASSSNIYSNEVKYIAKEPVTVKSSKGGLLVAGIYKEIKEKIVGLGGNYEKAIYGMDLKTYEIIKINLKGVATQAWGDFLQNVAKGKQFNNVISFAGGTTEKKGKINFSRPIFELGEVISEALDKTANDCYDMIEDYFKGDTTSASGREDEGEPEVYVDGVTDADHIKGANEDDLPF